MTSSSGALLGRLESLAARIIVLAWYSFALLICLLRPRGKRRPWIPSGVLVVTGTFHNPGWYRSHVVPLSMAGLREVVVVTHATVPAVAGVRVVAPPSWLTRIVGRSLARLVWTIVIGRQVRADVFMGYHILPNSTSALIAGRLLGRPACYQMTGGPVEVIGGGYRATENQIQGRLRTPSLWLERVAVAVVREFDLVVVRGRSARQFVVDKASPPAVAVVPGSVNVAQFARLERPRRCDLIFVGRLAPTKQPLQFVEIVDRVRRTVPGVRASIVGDGPLMPELRRLVTSLGLEKTIDIHGQVADVDQLVAEARLFVLTSRSEGLSIAMAEAMISGVVPVVADVGDLGDLVSDGSNGYLITPDDIAMYADRAARLLTDDRAWQRLSAAAAAAATSYNGIDRVSRVWREHLQHLAPRGAVQGRIAC